MIVTDERFLTSVGYNALLLSYVTYLLQEFREARGQTWEQLHEDMNNKVERDKDFIRDLASPQIQALAESVRMIWINEEFTGDNKTIN